jgi:hypothetical protein
VPLFKQELLTLSEHLSSYRYSEVRVAKSVVCFVDLCIVCFVDFYIVCSSNYSFDIFIFFLSVNMINCDIRYLLYVTTVYCFPYICISKLFQHFRMELWLYINARDNRGITE